MEWIGKPKYHKPCRIWTVSGDEYEATLIHLNPRYHTKAGELDVWRREDSVPKKQRYIQLKDVTVWEEI